MLSAQQVTMYDDVDDDDDDNDDDDKHMS